MSNISVNFHFYFDKYDIDIPIKLCSRKIDTNVKIKRNT